jgi:hypothetical protein
MSYVRINRLIKTKIRLYTSIFRDDPLKYWLKCETHNSGGPTEAFDKKSRALFYMARPWEWCEECKKLAEEL